MRRFIFLLVFACLPPAQGMAEDVRDTTVIVAFGDSLFAGFGVVPVDSFPDQLERRLKTDGYDVNVINFGIPGDTTAGGAARIDRTIALKPDIVLVELGTNDIWHGLPPADARVNLDRILSRLHAAGIKTLVMGEKTSINSDKAVDKAYDSLFCDLAKKYAAPCYPFFLKKAVGHPDLMQRDGLHPNPKGVTAIVDDVYPMVKKMMEQ